MRLIGALVVAVVMYVAVPLLWQRAILSQVNEMSANSADMPVATPLEINYEASASLANAINGPQINEDEMNEFARIGAQAAADDAMRQAQAASDAAWKATHP